MKFVSALIAIFGIICLGQAHQFPDFGSGALHEDVQDFLDLVPAAKINEIVTDYILGDSEVQTAIDYLLTSTIIKDIVVEVEAIPELINLINYVQKTGIDIYYIVNELNKALGINELVPPSHSAIMERTGGIAGLVTDIVKVIPIDKFIRTYAQKIKTSSDFNGLIDQLKSDNFQQVVNKVYENKSVQIILNGLKTSGVNTQIVADLLYIILGITVPNGVSFYQERTLEEELMDFVQLLPLEQFSEIVLKYMIEDQKIKTALLHMFTPEFHSSLREIEALKEYQDLVVYLEEAGLRVSDYIQTLHKIIGMEDYIPPKIESTFKSQIGMQKIGDGMKGLIEDLYNILPLDQIDALYKEKLQNSKVFADFIGKLMSSEMQKIIDNLYGNQTYKNFVMNAREKGLEFEELTKLYSRIFGIQFPY